MVAEVVVTHREYILKLNDAKLMVLLQGILSINSPSIVCKENGQQDSELIYLYTSNNINTSIRTKGILTENTKVNFVTQNVKRRPI